MDDEPDFKQLKEELPLKEVKILLFGSRARGDFYPDSDWDIAIISPEFEGLSWKERWKRCDILIREFIDEPTDIVYYTPKEYEKGKNGALPEHIEKEGRVVA